MVDCPNCGGENPDNAKFCLHCASPIVVAEPRRKERKYATALFADLVGSTSLADARIYLPEVEALLASIAAKR